MPQEFHTVRTAAQNAIAYLTLANELKAGTSAEQEAEALNGLTGQIVEEEGLQGLIDTIYALCGLNLGLMDLVGIDPLEFLPHLGKNTFELDADKD